MKNQVWPSEFVVFLVRFTRMTLPMRGRLKLLSLLICVAAVCIASAYYVLHRRMRSSRISIEADSARSGKTTAFYSTNNALSSRVDILERLGAVPENASQADWTLAARTTWWGKRIDPKEFWRGRTVWLSDENLSAARRKGRAYPPVPPEATEMEGASETDIATGATSEGLGTAFWFNSREAMFWKWASITWPLPPKQIEQIQLNLAKALLNGSRKLQPVRSPIPITDAEWEAAYRGDVNSAIMQGLPREAASSNAVFWTYVMHQREEFHRQVSVTPEEAREHAIDLFFSRCLVGRDLVLSRWTDTNQRDADAWKAKYLKRLADEGRYANYIHEYVKYWNLKADGAHE